VLTAAACLSVLFATDETALTSSFDLQTPPPGVVELLRTLKTSDRTSAGYARLFESLRLRPYLVDAVLGTSPPTDVTFRQGYALHFNELNAGRVKRWQKEGRIDLIAEAGVVAARCRVQTVETLVPELRELIREVVGERMPAVLGKKLPGGADEAKEVATQLESSWGGTGFLKGFPVIGRRREELPFDAGRTVTYTLNPGVRWKDGDLWSNPTSTGQGCLADRVIYPGYALHYGMGYVVSDEFVGFNHGSPNRDFDRTLLVCNAPLPLTAGKRTGIRVFSASAIVADGDVELNEGPHRAAVVIARGNITVDGHLTHQQSLFVAGGKITAAEEGKIDSCVLLAQGGFEVGGKKHANGKAGTQLAVCGPADVGIRWFDVADVGLTLGANKWRPVVTAVSEASPFRKVLEPKDVLRAVNGQPVRTEEEARRALRRAVAMGYAVVEFTRGRDEQSRLVLLPDVMK
jgi:hypothetical protein